MKVRNMTGRTGREVANQFIIEDVGRRIFQSYNTVIAIVSWDKVELDHNWDYSRTTSKYRNEFLGETTKETEAKIKSGEYIVTNLN